MNFPVNNLALVSLCTKNLKFYDLELVDKNERSQPETTSETHDDRIGFCCSLKAVCFGRYEQSIPGKDHLINGFRIYLFSIKKPRYLTDNQNLRFHNHN